MAVGVLGTVAAVGVPAAAAAARPRATQKKWVDLGPGQAYGINNAGQVVGGVGSNGTFRAVMWQNGTEVDLGTLPGLKQCSASAINNAGQVVGQCSNKGSTESHAFLWTRGVMKDLGTLPGSTDAGATAINADGDVVGVSIPKGMTVFHAVLWKNGTIRDLGVLGSGYVQSIARGINNSDQIVGWSTQTSKDRAGVRLGERHDARAARAERRSERSLGDQQQGPGRRRPAVGWPEAGAVGRRLRDRVDHDGSGLRCARDQPGGELAGWVDTAGGPTHAAMWAGKKLDDLGSVRGAPTVATAINDKGEVAGRTRPLAGHRGGRAARVSRRPARSTARRRPAAAGSTTPRADRSGWAAARARPPAADRSAVNLRRARRSRSS